MANKKPAAGFKKGDPRINRNGRPPKGTSLAETLRERVDHIKLADSLLSLAYDGDVAALKAVYDRIEGRPHESIELNTGGDIAVKLESILGGRK
ncbi:MAG: hypothetical protein Ta2A_11530 [Treponemataceae bacterium]|nr:MAG: hypothetical protein Ta2A_11530 [Treponemataceae bacterium]